MIYIEQLQACIEHGTFLLLHPLAGCNVMRVVQLIGTRSINDEAIIIGLEFQPIKYHEDAQQAMVVQHTAYIKQVKPTQTLLLVTKAEIKDICFVFSSKIIEPIRHIIEGRRDSFVVWDDQEPQKLTNNTSVWPRTSTQTYANEIWHNMDVIRQNIQDVLGNSKANTETARQWYAQTSVAISTKTWNYIVRQCKSEIGVSYLSNCKMVRQNGARSNDTKGSRQTYDKLAFRNDGGKMCLIDLFGEAAIHYIFDAIETTRTNDENTIREGTKIYSVDNLNLIHDNNELNIDIMHSEYTYHRTTNKMVGCKCALLEKYLLRSARQAKST